MTPEQRERQRELRRVRYASDPEYRERVLQRRRELYAANPTYREGNANRRDSDTRLIPQSGSKRTSGNANGMRQIPSIANGSARNSENAAQPGAVR